MQLALKKGKTFDLNPKTPRGTSCFAGPVSWADDEVATVNRIEARVMEDDRIIGVVGTQTQSASAVECAT
jgi:hypothetical protein